MRAGVWVARCKHAMQSYEAYRWGGILGGVGWEGCVCVS